MKLGKNVQPDKLNREKNFSLKRTAETLKCSLIHAINWKLGRTVQNSRA